MGARFRGFCRDIRRYRVISINLAAHHAISRPSMSEEAWVLPVWHRDGEVEPGVCCTYVGYRLGIILD
jgi:hypothetical protein